ncbi:MAG: hypothetical protein AAGD38_07080 [Acidobacteriota bacterium]
MYHWKTTLPLAPVLDLLVDRLRPILPHAGDDVEDLLRQALAIIAIDETPEDPALSTRLAWQRRQRQVADAADRALRDVLEGDTLDTESRRFLETWLGNRITGLPAHCRTPLRLRYGLRMESDEVTVKLGHKGAVHHRTVPACTPLLAADLLAAALDD